MADTTPELLRGMRRATALLLADHFGLAPALSEGLVVNSDANPPEARVARALEALGLARHDGDVMRWNDAWSWLASTDRWDSMIALLRHQLGYATMADALVRGVVAVPLASQPTDDPDAYLAFLEGVGRSHATHARWLAALERLAGCEALADLGGGVGTFSEAWIASRPTRTAVLADLPAVVRLVSTRRLLNPRIRLGAIDLSVPVDVHPSCDVVLLANVLHLLPDWRASLAGVVVGMRPGTTLAVLEADPTDEAGAVFELQVLLRSGGTGALLAPAALSATLAELPLEDVTRDVVPSDEDPLERRSLLWTARRRSD